MNVLVINAGSSSLKCKLFSLPEGRVLFNELVQNIGEKGSEVATHHDALIHLKIDFKKVDLIAHRVVHGGEKFSKAVLIDAYVKQEIRALFSLAPLHNPANLEGIEVMQEFAKEIPQVALFDTAFHSTMQAEAYLYALPYELYEKHTIRRYGFHGLSHSYVLKEAAKILDKPVEKCSMVTLHLGNGASVCAIENGKSIETSMGFTPLEGLVMGSRSGDLDPSIVLYLQEELGLSVAEVSRLLNKESGLVGICGENDVRKILQSEERNAALAIRMMVRRIQKYVGAYMALLDEVDAIVFTGGIGENSEYIRKAVMQSRLLSQVKCLVINTDEELEMARESLKYFTHL